MAVPYTTFESRIRTYVDPTVPNVWYEVDPIIETVLKSNKKTHRGRSVQFPINYQSSASRGTIQPLGEYAIAKKEYATLGTLSWVNYYATIAVSQLEEDMSGGPEMIWDDIENQIQQGMTDIKSMLSSDLYSLGGTVSDGGVTRDRISGLLAITTPSVAYAGITPTTAVNTWWQPYSLNVASATNPSTGAAMPSDWDGSGTYADLTTSTSIEYLPRMARMMSAQLDNGTDRYNFIVCDESTYTAWHSLFVAKQEPMQEVDVGKMGFTGLKWQNRFIYESKYCPTGYMFFVNSNHLEAHFIPGREGKFTGFKDLGAKQEGKAGRFDASFALVCRNRKRQGMVSNMPQQ